jgi:hypothetical protein
MLCGAFLQCCIKSLSQDAAGRVASAAMRVESFQLFTKYFQFFEVKNTFALVSKPHTRTCVCVLCVCLCVCV